MGGQAKWRRDEIAELKRRSPEDAARWRQMQENMRQVASGIDPESSDLTVRAAMARAMGALLFEAKRSENVDPVVAFLHETISATLRRFSDVPVACRKGCSHCCHIWVSVSAPEILHIAKTVAQCGDAAIEKVRAAHEGTKDYDFDARYHHPHPCPLLEGDACSIYDARPKACRFAASIDAGICDRTYHQITNEGVPTPAPFVMGRDVYGMVIAAGLRHAKFPYQGYEMNAALHRALQTDHAEQRWLSGEDIFAGIHRDAQDIFDHPAEQYLYAHAFPRA
jgi:hypothetical protein